jgi:BlaI family penicillinase repressor
VSALGPQVSDAEMVVLKALWMRGPSTVRDVESCLNGPGRNWAYNTVLTLLSRLRDKGYVAGDKTVGDRGGSALVFRPIVTRDQLLRDGLTDLADRVCDGTASPLVHALVKGRGLTSADIADLRRLLDELEQDGLSGTKG